MRRISLLVLMIAACSADSDHATDASIDGSVDAGPDAAPRYRAELIRTVPYVDDQQRSWTNQLVRVVRSDGVSTYVQYIPSDKPGPRPVVVMTMPYAGIDWTGEEVDSRWAGYTFDAAGRHLDVDGPNFDGTSLIIYEPLSIAAADDQAHIHLLNDFAVVLVYGRFYAGGSVADDVADMKAGMWFVAEQDAVDKQRVGVFGGSWGGFEALYASAYADPRAPARVTVAEYPPSDLSTIEPHFEATTGVAHDGLVPYVHRIKAGTAGGTDYSGLRATDLCAGLPAKTLVLHDEHDNLVPFAQSTSLLSACGGDAQFWLRTGAIDTSVFTHGPLLEEPGAQSVVTYALDYLALNLATPAQPQLYSIYTPQALLAHLATVKAAQVAGRDVSFAAPRLLELADPRLQLLNFSDGTFRAGAEVAATTVNATWGTSYTAASIRSALATGLPPP